MIVKTLAYSKYLSEGWVIFSPPPLCNWNLDSLKLFFPARKVLLSAKFDFYDPYLKAARFTRKNQDLYLHVFFYFFFRNVPGLVGCGMVQYFIKYSIIKF